MGKALDQLPATWRWAQFQEIAGFTIGRTPPRAKSEYWTVPPDGIPWVSIADMRPFRQVLRTAEAVTTRAADAIFGKPPSSKGSLIMSFKLTIGRTSVLEYDAYHNEAIISITPGPDADKDYLRFFLPTIPYSQLQDRAIKGNTLNLAKIAVLPIALPSIVEQRAIAGVLCKIQRAIELEEKRIAVLKELKAATMAKVFREGLRGERLKKTEIGEIPESWDVRELGAISKIASGGTPSREHPEYWDGTIPWVRTGEIDYRMISTTGERITEDGLANSSAQIFPCGTLLMAMYGQGITRGRVAMLGIDAATNQACAAIFPDKRFLSSGFLYSYFTYAYLLIRNMGYGANQKNLSGEILKRLKLPVPAELKEQEAISNLIASVQRRIEIAESRSRRVQDIFSSTLHQLMTGKLRVFPVSEEVFDGRSG